MAILQSPIKEKFESLIKKSNDQFENGKHNDSIITLEEAWGLLPEPKGIYSEESFHLVKDIIDTCFVIKDFKKAKEWSDKIYLTGFARKDTGKKEFMSGKVAFELGDVELAKEFFSIANKKSEGRCFEDEDSKYLKCFKT
ncbi:hypothetical protein [Paenibacillus turpanensis]|uniref:hypothetical protein n=1 Tax=Paenibacillus turpanensis TaxID=2689078 RepID=UPI0014090BAB|nr:hypothetical protein [Paenibacillus turpanensis]